MANIGGFLILVAVSVLIIMLRYKIDSGDNEYLKRAKKVGDAIIWIRAIMGLLMIALVLLFAAKAGRH